MALSKVKKGGITDTAIKQGLPSSTVSEIGRASCRERV